MQWQQHEQAERGAREDCFQNALSMQMEISVFSPAVMCTASHHAVWTKHPVNRSVMSASGK